MNSSRYLILHPCPPPGSSTLLGMSSNRSVLPSLLVFISHTSYSHLLRPCERFWVLTIQEAMAIVTCSSPCSMQKPLKIRSVLSAHPCRYPNTPIAFGLRSSPPSNTPRNAGDMSFLFPLLRSCSSSNVRTRT